MGDRVAFINNTLQSLFCNCDVLISNEKVHTSNNSYVQRAFFETELFTLWAAHCQNWLHKATNLGQPSMINTMFNKHGLKVQPQKRCMAGKMHVEFLACDQLRFPGCSVRIKLTRSKNEYVFRSAVADAAFEVKVFKNSLFARWLTLVENYPVYLQRSLPKWPVKCDFFEVRSKTFDIPTGQKQFVRRAYPKFNSCTVHQRPI